MLEQRENFDVCQGEGDGGDVIWFAFLKDFEHSYMHSPNNNSTLYQYCLAKEKI